LGSERGIYRITGIREHREELVSGGVYLVPLIVCQRVAQNPSDVGDDGSIVDPVVLEQSGRSLQVRE
jgi:hypothetical protein